MTLEIPADIDVWHDEVGVTISSKNGWAVPISWSDASRYLEQSRANPNEGFYERPQTGQVVLAHKGPRLTLTQRSATALKSYIRENLPVTMQ